MKKTSESQLKAIKRWNEKNRKEATKQNYRRTARTFARHHATKEEMDELMEIFYNENPNAKKEG